jgi:hypothetical protein
MNNRQMLDKWREFYATALFDLPAAAAQTWLLGADQRRREERLGKAVWRAYDAWLWLANEAANQLYSTTTGHPSALAGRLRLVSPALEEKAQSAPTVRRAYQSGKWLEAR